LHLKWVDSKKYFAKMSIWKQFRQPVVRIFVSIKHIYWNSKRCLSQKLNCFCYSYNYNPSNNNQNLWTFSTFLVRDMSVFTERSKLAKIYKITWCTMLWYRWISIMYLLENWICIFRISGKKYSDGYLQIENAFILRG
jgi:hypothetical protein